VERKTADEMKMNSKWILAGWLAAGLCCAGCGRGNEALKKAPSEANATWLTNFETAQARARSEGKLLLIDFTGSDWCPPCIMLDRQVFSQAEFAEYANQHLVLLEVDFPRTKEQSAEQKAANEKLADRFGIDGFPTVIILDSDGKKIGELGYMPGGAKAFVAALEALRRKA
jgi:protein disulfide-isomerase